MNKTNCITGKRTQINVDLIEARVKTISTVLLVLILTLMGAVVNSI